VSKYHHMVMVDGGGPEGKRGVIYLYRGDNAADAMAAWSQAITDGREYVTLESLKETPGPVTS
jgi:hypothetical protein